MTKHKAFMVPSAWWLGRHLSNSIHFYPDNDPAGGAGGGSKTDEDEEEDDEEEDPEPKKGKKGKTFSQEDLDKHVANERRSLQEKHLKETNKLLQDKDLTDKERKRLEDKKEELETALSDEKTKSRMDREKLEKEHAKKLQEKQDEADTWQKRYAEATIKRTITDAAVDAGAHDPAQIVDMFEHKTRLQEILDGDNKPTGMFEVVIEQSEKDEKTGKVIKKNVEIGKFIKETHSVAEKSKNLYDSSRVGGTGTRPGSTGGASGGKKSTMTSTQKIAKGLAALKANS